jgi:hypothetical protein
MFCRGVVSLVEPSLSAEQESGIAEAMDEADRGETMDGPTAMAAARRRARGGV